MEYRTLDINIISAKRLMNVNKLTKMDVYVVVSMSGDKRTKQETKVDRNGGTSPTWNFPMKFMVDESAAQQNHLTFMFTLRCKRTLGDKDIGQVHVPIKELLGNIGDGKMQFVSYQVRKPSGEPQGELSFSYKFGEKVAGAAAKADEPVTAYLPPPQHAAGPYPPPAGGYPPPSPPHGGYAPPPVAGCGYPPPPQPQYGWYPPPLPPHGGYAPPPVAGYGYPPPPPPQYGWYPPPLPPRGGYAPPPVAGYGYPPLPPPQNGWYPPPPQLGYGYPPPQLGYGYPPQPGYCYPRVQPGLGLGEGLLRGVMIVNMISDAGDYIEGFGGGGV